MSSFAVYREKWNEFCESTSIHGLDYAFAKKNIVFVTKCFWVCIVAVMFVLCSYQTYSNIMEYFQYKMHVSITYETQSNLTFPAITFSPMTMFRRSGIGNVSAASVLLSTWLSEKDNQVPLLMKQNQMTCRSALKSNFTSLVDAEGLNVIYSIGLPQTAQTATINFESTLLKCWWKNKDFNCSDVFINHLSDTFASFSFNAGGDLISQLFNNPIPNYPLVVAGYGINRDNYNVKDYYVNSPSHSLRLLLNVNQKEYCGNDILKRGSGFMFSVHDVNGVPSFIINKFYYLSPGYNIDVSMRQVVVKRLQGHGICSNTADLYFFPMLNNSNIMNACFLQCATELLLQYCKCYIPPLLPFDQYIKEYSYKFNMSKENVKFCWDMSEIACMRRWRQTVFNNQLYILCPKCKELCVEGQYDIQITQNRLSKLNYGEWINASDLADFKKNYLMVNFHFSDMNLQTIVITENFTLKDLFIYFGTNIGLFLGMSFVSLFELGDMVIQLFHILLASYNAAHFKHNTKVTRIGPPKKVIKRVHTVTLQHHRSRLNQRTTYV